MVSLPIRFLVLSLPETTLPTPAEFLRENGGNRNGNYRGAPRQDGGFRRENNAPAQNRPQRAPMQPAAPKTADQLFEEKLKAFMSESDNKLSSMRADHRTKSRRR